MGVFCLSGGGTGVAGIGQCPDLGEKVEFQEVCMKLDN